MGGCGGGGVDHVYTPEGQWGGVDLVYTPEGQWGVLTLCTLLKGKGGVDLVYIPEGQCGGGVDRPCGVGSIRLTAQQTAADS